MFQQIHGNREPILIPVGGRLLDFLDILKASVKSVIVLIVAVCCIGACSQIDVANGHERKRCAAVSFEPH